MPTSAFIITTSTSRINPSRIISGNTKRSSAPFTMVLDSIDNLPVGRVYKDTFRKLTKLIRVRGGQCDWTVNDIATRCKMKYETYRKHQQVLKEVGAIKITPRPIGGCRNAPNIIALGGGVVVENDHGITTEKNLKTKAPTREVPRVGIAPPSPEPVKPVAPSRFRSDWEANREWHRRLNQAAHDRMVASYVAVGIAIVADIEAKQARRGSNQREWREGKRHRWDGGREHRRDQARHRCRVAGPDPMVGAGVRPDGFYSAQPHESDADREYREKYQRIQNERKVNTK
jgi:hypothetical protein